MRHSQGCCSICNLLGALKNTTPSSGEISLLQESSAQTKSQILREFAIKAATDNINNMIIKALFLTFDVRAQLQLRHLPLQEGVDPGEVLCPDVCQ